MINGLQYLQSEESFSQNVEILRRNFSFAWLYLLKNLIWTRVEQNCLVHRKLLFRLEIFHGHGAVTCPLKFYHKSSRLMIVSEKVIWSWWAQFRLGKKKLGSRILRHARWIDHYMCDWKLYNVVNLLSLRYIQTWKFKLAKKFLTKT